jgi:twinkle protein
MYHDELNELDIKVRYGARGDVKVPCPKCSHERKKKTDPSLSANVDTGQYNCHHCGYSGSVARSNSKEYVPKKEYKKPPPLPPLQKVPTAVGEWFAGRGISNNTILRYKVTASKEVFPQATEAGEKAAINFNYFNIAGERVNVKYRSKDKEFKIVGGAQLIPYGLDVAFENVTDSILITEGEIDVLSWYEAGIPFGVSVPNGAPPPPKNGKPYSPKLEWLDDCWSMFEGIEKVYIAMDSDLPGQMLAEELARRLGKERCFIIKYPEGYKDANEVLNGDANKQLPKLGKDDLRECFAFAELYPIEGIEDAETAHDELLHLLENGLPEGLLTGSALDEFITWHGSMVSLITGIPGHGKTSFLKQLQWWLTEKYGWKWLIYSGEEASTAMALSDLFSIATDKSFFANKDNPYEKKISKAEIQQLMPFMKDHFKYMKLDEDSVDIDKILGKAKELVKRTGIKALVIDNMSTVEGILPKQGETRHHAVGDLLTKVIKAARTLGLHIFLVAHPKKMQDVDGMPKVPNGYDVGDSSHYFNKPDIGFTVYRNYDTKQTDIVIWKNRFKYAGTTGKVSFTFDRKTGRFQEGKNDGSDQRKFVGQPYSSNDRFSNV